MIVKRAILAWFALTLAGSAAVYFWSRIDLGPAPGPKEAEWALRALEAARRGVSLPPPPPGAERYRAAGPIIVSAWWGGRLRARHLSNTDRLVPSILAAAGRFANDPNLVALPGEPTAAEIPPRFRITVIRGHGPLLCSLPLLDAMGLVPLLEGVETRLGDRRAFLTPDQIWAEGFYERGITTPVPDLSFGIDLAGVLKRLAAELDLSSDELLARATVRRFRADTIAERPYPARRPKKLTAELLENAAREGARFLLRHQKRNGLYTYIYDGRNDRDIPTGYYSMPRHAGTTHFLAQAGRLLSMRDARYGALRAMHWSRMNALRRCGGPERFCILSSRGVDMGSAALTALAAAELLKGGNNRQLRWMLHGLAAFIRSMQRPDGELMHVYDLKTNRPVDVQRMYYSGEAAFALLNAYPVTEDERDLETARKLMGHLTGAAWSFFGSRYFYGEEHWTCQAASEASRYMPAEEALEFCLRWAAFNRVLQYRPGKSPWAIEGAYGVGPLLLPRLTPVASRTEALVAIYGAAKEQGLPTAALRKQIEKGLGLLLRYMWLPGPEHLLLDPRAALGGVPGFPADLTVRNDFVQHAGTAMLNWAQILRQERE